VHDADDNEEKERLVSLMMMMITIAGDTGWVWAVSVRVYS
jgi:hypothetical protein